MTNQALCLFMNHLIRDVRHADLLDFLKNVNDLTCFCTIFSFYLISISSRTDACCIMFNLLVKLDLSSISTSVFTDITFDLR